MQHDAIMVINCVQSSLMQRWTKCDFTSGCELSKWVPKLHCSSEASSPTASCFNFRFLLTTITINQLCSDRPSLGSNLLSFLSMWSHHKSPLKSPKINRNHHNHHKITSSCSAFHCQVGLFFPSHVSSIPTTPASAWAFATALDRDNDNLGMVLMEVSLW
jgi:hypothetical protein